MKKLKKIILFLLIFIFNVSKGIANTIDINTFYALINSSLQNGDTYNITNNLSSNETIGNHFFNYNINFDGNYHTINGNGEYGGFVLSKDNNFSEVSIKNCMGQLDQGSNFAGAIFNHGGNTNIKSSDFNGNFVNSGNINFGVAGAIYNLNGGNMTIQNSSFENNYTYGAGAFGGALANGYNDNGTAQMTIKNTTFNNNYSDSDSIARGGAIYNTGIINIENSSFEQNYVEATEQERTSPFISGGAIDNLGDMTINNAIFKNNYAKGVQNSASFGGAIMNNKNLNITNSTFDGNYIDSSSYGYGGAIYNNTDGNLSIANSTIQNNKISNSLIDGEGGAIYNAGTITLDNVNLQKNYDKSNDLNDIYNTATGTINFIGSGTNQIKSGIKGTGIINKSDNGILNLGGNNNNFTGTFNFNAGTLNLLPNSSYFEATNTNLGNNINFNMINNENNDINFGNLSLSGKANIYADMNLNTDTMDKINANSISGNGSLFVAGLNISGTPKSQYISIPFADNVLKNYVEYTPSSIETPIYDYKIAYNNSDGNFELTRQGFSSAILSSEIATQLAGYLTQIDTYHNVFSNLDMVMITPPDIKSKFSQINKIAASNPNFAYSPLLFPEQRNGIWFKPYATFESVGLKNGPRVSNVAYGSIVGVESGLKELNKNWYSIYGLYASYNGSNQAFQGNNINNNGGLLGVDAVFYKGNFFTAWTINVGANSSESTTKFGKENFAMLNTGIAQMSGYNIETLQKRFIIQPSITTSYSFINTFNYKTSSNVQVNTKPLNAIQIEPKIKLIGNFKEYMQPYIAVSMVWNVIDSTKFKADDIYLPNLSIKPFVQYGAGVQKRFGDRVTGFFETLLRNGGRNGVCLQFGLRMSI